MLKFSANISLLFPELPLTQRFAAAHAAGFTAVEIQFPYELKIPQLQKLLTDNSLELALINVPTGDLMQGGNGLACVPEQEPVFRAAVTQALEYAEALSVPVINILSGKKPAEYSLETCMRVLTNNIEYAVSAAKHLHVHTVIEAINVFDMPHFLVHSLEDMRFLCNQISGLRMQFDCYHMSRMGEDVIEALHDNLALIGHIQFADNPGRHEPGTGKIDYRRIFSFLNSSDYKGWCGAEYHPSKATSDTLAWLNWEHSQKTEDKEKPE
jgi:hydroxypyruvate isomerase